MHLLKQKLRSSKESHVHLNNNRSANASSFSVVAVHGIGVHPNETWIDRKSKTDWLSSESMLPKDIPEARIMTFNYNSVWFGDNAVKQSLESVATKLLRALLAKRKVCCCSPP